MERGHNDEKQHKHHVLRFTRKNRMSVFLEPNMIRGIYMVVMYTGWSELKVWPHQYIYRLYTGWVRCHKSWLKWSFLVVKLMVVGETHHFRKSPDSKSLETPQNQRKYPSNGPGRCKLFGTVNLGTAPWILPWLLDRRMNIKKICKLPRNLPVPYIWNQTS